MAENIDQVILDSEGIRDETQAGQNTALRVGQNLTDLGENIKANAEGAGFIDYNDSNGSIALVAETWTDVPNDGAGAFTNKGFSPVDELMDVATGYLDFSELSAGDDLLVRLDLKVIPNINNALLEVRYVLGTGGGEYVLEANSKRLDSGSGKEYSPDKGAFYIYLGDTNTAEGVGKIQVKLSSAGTMINSGIAVKILKK